MVDGIFVDVERKDGEGYTRAWRTMMCNHIYGNEFCRSECAYCDYN
jgi:hypothetical protein